MEAVAIAPDGKRLASASSDGQIQLWDLATRQELWCIHSLATRLTFSPDGKLLASGQIDGQGNLWEVATSARITQWQLGERRSSQPDIAFTPDGKVLAARQLSTLLLWDVPANRQLARINSKQWHRCLTISGDGQRFAFIIYGLPTAHATFSLGDVISGAEVMRFAVAQRPRNLNPRALAFSSDDRILYCVSGSRAIRQWELASGRELPELASSDFRAQSFLVVRAAACIRHASPMRRVAPWKD